MLESSPRQRLHTLIDATRAAVSDPEDTAQVFRIAEALSFGNPERMLRRFRKHEAGGRLLAQRDEILDLLRDRERLEAMAPDSLGRAYLAFLDAEGISADGLIAASVQGTSADYHDADDDLAWVRRRMRDTHDLWHAVTGYKGDLLGETALLAFIFAQTRHPGIGFLAGLGVLLSFDPRGRRMIADGFRRGLRASWFPPTDWATLLPRPIEEVRRELGVTAVEDYEPVREPPRWTRAVASA